MKNHIINNQTAKRTAKSVQPPFSIMIFIGVKQKAWSIMGTLPSNELLTSIGSKKETLTLPCFIVLFILWEIFLKFLKKMLSKCHFLLSSHNINVIDLTFTQNRLNQLKS